MLELAVFTLQVNINVQPDSSAMKVVNAQLHSKVTEKSAPAAVNVAQVSALMVFVVILLAAEASARDVTVILAPGLEPAVTLVQP